MADFYWVGGNGNWSDYAAHWATTSGGATFQTSEPTSADKVIFDDNSAAGTFTVTIDTAGAICGIFDASGITNAARKMTLTGTASVGLLSVNGSWTNPTSTYFAWTGWTGNIVTFAANSTIITNAVSFVPAVVVSGSGITITLGGAFTTSSTVTITQGTFDTSGSNYALTATGIVISANSNTKALTLNGSAVSLSATAAYTDNSTGNFTLNAGTSTITCSNANPTLAGNGATFYNVTFSSVGLGVSTVTGANTFSGTLTQTSRNVNGMRTITFAADQTIDTLTLGAGNTGSRRLLCFSDTIGTQRTLTVTTFSATTDIDFRDIQAAGNSISGANWNSAGTGRFGDCGGNGDKITFDSPKTVYWNLAAGGNWSDTAWAASSGSGAAVSTNNFPLAQDTAVFQSDTATLGSGNTITMNSNFCLGSVDTSARTSNTMTLAFGSAATSGVYGDFNIGSGVTPSSTSASIPFSKQGIQTITYSSSTAFPKSVVQNGLGGTVRLNGNFTLASANAYSTFAGTLDLTNNGGGNYTLSTGLFNTASSLTRSIEFGTGAITITGVGTVWNSSTTTGLTISGTPTVNISNNSATATTVSTGALSESQAMNFNYTTGTYTLTDTNAVYRNLSFNGFTGTVPNSARTIYGNLTIVSGPTYTSGTNATTFAATSGTQQITTNSQTIDYPIVQNNPGSTLQPQDNLTLGSTRSFTLTAGTLDLSGKTLTASTFTNSGANTRAITFNGGVISLSGAGSTVWNASGSGFTSSAGTANGTITLTSGSAKTFVGGSFTYAAALNQGGAGALTVSGDNTFYGLSNTVQPATITITASSTQTFTGAVTLAGTSGNLITLASSSAGTQYTFTYPSSTSVSSLSYCSITDCIGYQNAYWQAYQSNGCVNGGNNLGWIFYPLVYNAGGYQFST